MASKDPAFLFYPKDWLQGTAEMTPEEKGVYIDLLAHQHQRGGLPTETKRLSKMVGLSEPDFLKIWQLLKTKFVQSDDQLVNQKLHELTTDRLSKSHTNKITGKFATLIRSINHLSKDVVATLKKEFKITDFDHLPTEQATERLTEWFYVRLKSIANENVNENRDSIGGVGEKEGVCFDVESYLLGNQKEFEAVCMASQDKDPEHVKEVLQKFHLWMVAQDRYPQKPVQLIAGFKIWLLDPKNAKNGKYGANVSMPGKTITFDKA